MTESEAQTLANDAVAPHDSQQASLLVWLREQDSAGPEHLTAAQAALQQVGADAFSAARLVHQHGYRWDDDGHWSQTEAEPDARARLLPGDVLLVDEAGMLEQDTARALFASPTERTRLSRCSVIATSWQQWAAAASSSSPHVGCDPQRTTSSNRSTGSASPHTPTSACSCATVSALV